ncbi:hypothetical protein OEZ85_000326 [Tetradesmus obliquus]|uniref:Uncharacterized protein n=1 Tax=Tetradesmus obliquus TaxID=3088 RepID=A0ABY8UQL4_TETOB|nr:hypothetical protein OEZ85_000326 [Tetradesmus obliquus]
MQRKVHATIPYAIEGSHTVIGADGTVGKYGLGAQVVFHHRLLKESGGQQIGHLSGHCHIVAKQSDREWVAVCTKHYDWFDGSTMTAHATETVGPDNKRITEKLVIAGGIGQWEGAHGVDESYTYDPARGRGSGKIILTCLKGVC